MLAFAVGEGAAAQWTTVPVAGPRLQYRTFASSAAGATVSFHIYTPPQYDTQPARDFPVVYWLHGSGSPTNGIAPMTNRFHAAISQGIVPPMIVVFPNGMAYSMWSDSANGNVPMETVVIDELIPHLDATFRTIASRQGRIVEGFSMGGYGAARFGLRHSDLFAGASLFGAGPVQTNFLDAPPGSDTPLQLRLQIYENVWSSDPAIFLAQSPWMLAQTHAAEVIASGIRIRQAIGEADTLLQQNIALHDRFASLGIPHAFTTHPGVGHDALQLLNSMGDSYWQFYREMFAPPVCDAIDMNRDGSAFDPQDIDAFLSVFSEGPCVPQAATCGDIDFNNDGSLFDPCDIDAFLLVFSEGPCTLCGE